MITERYSNAWTYRESYSSELPPKQQHIHLVEVHYCKDTRPRSQLEATNQDHSVGGAIYSPYNTEPLKNSSLRKPSLL